MTAEEVVERILALRALTKETGCITRRTQNELLASLPGDVLAEVAVKLNQRKEGHERNERPRLW
jgi:hypothetical protein